MPRFLIRRVALIGITLLIVSVIIFVATEILPGDVASVILGQSATPEDLENLRRDLGLDRPLYVRYLDWITGVLRGDLGVSAVFHWPVFQLVTERLGNSAILAGFGFLVAVPAAVLTGVWAGVHKESLGDRIASILALVGISLPEFVTGVFLIVLFSSTLGLLPASSVILPGTSPFTRPQILVMPALTLTGVLFAYIMRMTRENVIAVMESNYVRTAVLKGLPMRRIVIRHVVPNAMLPTITVIASSIGWMFGGLIIVESVFSYAGLGRLMMDAVTNRDVPLLQALALLSAATYSFCNLVADLCYAALNPRVRLG